MKKAIIVSGYFNPLHKGHIELFEISKQLCDMLIVIVNSDLQRYLKGNKEFQLEEELIKLKMKVLKKYIRYIKILIN